MNANMNDLQDWRWSLALSMYQETQKKITDLDSTCFKIKGWTITVWPATSGFAVQQNNRSLLILFCCSVFLFWFVDIFYKCFQEQFLMISRRIEGRLCEGRITDGDLPLLFPSTQITSQLFMNWRPASPLRAALGRYWHHAPYGALIACSVALFFFFPSLKP